MIPLVTFFQIHPLFLRAFWTCIGIFAFAVSIEASKWRIQINMIDSHLASLGGERSIFLEVSDENNQHIANLSGDNVTFNINNEPYLYSGFGYQFQRMEQRIAFLVDLRLPAASQDLETIRNALGQFILQKEGSEEIFLHFNGSGQNTQAVGSKEKFETLLQNLKLDPAKKIPISELITGQSALFQQRGKRQWLILQSSDFASWNGSPALEKEMTQFFLNQQITLISIVTGVVPPWLKRLVSQTGSEIYQMDSSLQLPSVLQQIREKILQEYLLTYQLNALGNIPHDIEIKFIAKHGVESIAHQADTVSISLHSQTPLPLWGLVCMGGILFAGFGRIWLKNRSSAVLSKQIGFQILTPGEKFQSIPLEENSYALDFLSSIRTKGKLRLSANLEKVFLIAEQNSYFLEDKNYKNALLINRRRVRRTLLRHGDILDIGEMTLIFLNNIDPPKPATELDIQDPVPVYFDKPLGPIRKKIGTLINMGMREEYYLVKNITFIGRSKTNNIVLNSSQIALRHAKIMRVGTQYKLVSLSNQEGTFVNRRRVEQRFLKEGDEISFENCQFRFRMLNLASSRSNKVKTNVHHA